MKTKIYALGGLDEVGKNMYCIEHGDEILAIDGGIKFADDNLLGINGLIPDVTHIQKNKSKFIGILITHGHEDHIGGIPYIQKLVNIPKIWAPKIVIELLKGKFKEHKIKYGNFQEYNKESIIKTKYFVITPFVVNHSMPDCFGFAIQTPNGLIITTGDFKIDMTPVTERSDLQKIANLSQHGVDLLLSDSTNSLAPGFSNSEGPIAGELEDVIKTAEGRVIFATFASNVGRVSKAIQLAAKHNRKVIAFGRSMDRNVEAARKINYINASPDVFTNKKTLKNNGIKDTEIFIVCTGSQGEELAALNRMANGLHQSIKLKSTDTIVFSSNAIPGNFYTVEKLVNKLFRFGLRIIDTSTNPSIHASGHCNRGEQRIMHSLIKTKYFMPVHGEYKMLKEHSKTWLSVGGSEEKTFMCSNGDVLTLENGVVNRGKEVDSGALYIDGSKIIKLSPNIMEERKMMSTQGAVSVTVAINPITNKIISRPIILSKGAFVVKESGDVIRECQRLVIRDVYKVMESGKPTFATIKKAVKDATSYGVYKTRGIKTLVIPTIISYDERVINKHLQVNTKTSIVKQKQES